MRTLFHKAWDRTELRKVSIASENSFFADSESCSHTRFVLDSSNRKASLYQTGRRAKKNAVSKGKMENAKSTRSIRNMGIKRTTKKNKKEKKTRAPVACKLSFVFFLLAKQAAQLPGEFVDLLLEALRRHYPTSEIRIVRTFRRKTGETASPHIFFPLVCQSGIILNSRL